MVQDDDVQSPIATRFFASLDSENPGFIASVVLAEISWVLSRGYKASRERIASSIEGLLGSVEIVVENAEAAHRALAEYQASRSGDFADALIAQTALLAGATGTVTFDRDASAELGMQLLG